MSNTFDIEASFAIEATVPGDAAYSSVKARASLGIVEQVEAASEEDARDQALALLSAITEDVKLHLAANAPGADFYTDEFGVGQIGIAETTVAPKESSGSPTTSTPTTQTSGDSKFTPINHGGDRYTILWNGKQRTVFDNRETQSGNQPDLKMPEGRNGEEEVALWIITKSGGKNKAAMAVLHQIEESVPA